MVYNNPGLYLFERIPCRNKDPQSEIGDENIMNTSMNNSIGKEKWWVYPVLFIIGIVSLPLGLLSIGLLSGILIGLQNFLCEAGWCGNDLFWASQFILPFLICSLLVSLIIYYFKRSSIALALKAFIISFAIISFLFFGGISLSNLGQIPIHPFFILLFILLIAFLVIPTALKEHPLIVFAIRAFSISFIAVILAFFAWMFFSMGQSGMFMVIEEVNIPAGEKVRFVEITHEELEKYPPLKKAFSAYTGPNRSEFKVDYEDHKNLSDFFNKKRSLLLFSISDGRNEEYLNKGVVWQELINTFILNNFSLSGNATINQIIETMWDIFEKQYLFSIKDEGLEIELNKVNITLEGENYEIWKKDGYLNVYKQEELVYEILKEDGVLNVYDRKYSGEIIYKIAEKYYRISLLMAD
jgi:hypothetical protein